MELIVNGETRNFSDIENVADLLKDLNLNGDRVAVEVNLEIVRREDRSSHKLNDQDKIESRF